MVLNAVVIRPSISHHYKAGTEHAECSPDQARINHQARSAVVCSAIRMKGELHLAKIARPESY